ncbi:anthranilate synthase component 2/para-aminobenzoate synthetase component 2 [Salirhabdus euzebyi]|uniref:Anthranilate synthase component 2/para-aminobenzoate synthetase component 2 n=1 Tax=Salirhabdus euzebyi TaxID=394506 RepID=A0A841Q549_9BACI|nr:aminodeoxychorismate/anthranilate synthase component II [Salirhabdus euzebyi]MBB6453518.1 anthranilate synthase component 2/para-aminobenzoate synthetase component 2 [Salirhabdus euzebyi]
MIVIIDNYDSFTFNLVQYFKKIDTKVQVYRNTDITMEELKQINPDLIVFSPGPGTPADSGICKDILHTFQRSIPILGVCLGHQTIVEFFGGKIKKGKQPMHGKVTTIEHNGVGLFRGIPSPSKVTRYHSLIATELPKELETTALSEDGAVMAITHRTLPIYGIQFHPESILTEFGYEMLVNCYQLAINWQEGKRRNEDIYETSSNI